jgi:hypothetical protein
MSNLVHAWHCCCPWKRSVQNCMCSTLRSVSCITPLHPWVHKTCSRWQSSMDVSPPLQTPTFLTQAASPAGTLVVGLAGPARPVVRPCCPQLTQLLK